MPHPLAAARGSLELRVTLLGDSITEGGNVNPERAWAVQFARELSTARPDAVIMNRALGARYSGHYLRADYVGAAQEPSDISTGYGWRNGYDTGRAWVSAGQSWRDAVRATRPNLLVVAFGMNEVWSGTTDAEVLAQWRSNLTALLDDAATWTPQPSVVLMTPMLPSTTAPSLAFDVIPASRILGVADVLRDTAQSRNMYLADVTAAWQASPLTEAEKLGTWPGTWNGIEGGGNGYNHPTERAHAEIFMPVMREVIRALQ